MRKRGEITVFLTMILVCVWALLCGLVESARTAGARCYLRQALDSSMDSLFGQYHRKLWESYRLLGLEYGTPGDLEGEFREFLAPYLEAQNWYPLEAGEISAVRLTALTDEDGACLEEQILAYMKYGLLSTTWDELKPDEAAELFRAVKEAGAVKEAAGAYKGHAREAVKLEKALEQLNNSLEKQRKLWETGAERLRGCDGGGFLSQAARLDTELGKVPGLVKAYEKKADGLDRKLKESRNEYESRAGDLSQTVRDGLEAEIRQYEAYTDRDGERRRQVEALDGLSQQNREYVRQVMEEARSVQEYIDSWEPDDEDEDDELDEEALWRPVRARWGAYPVLALNVEFGIQDKETEGFLERVQELISGDLLALLLPEGETASEQRPDLTDAPSTLCGYGKSGEAGGNSAAGLVDRLMIGEYALRYFDYYGRKPIKDGCCAYETEYLLFGHAGDRENLSSAASRLLAVREGLNLIHILSDPQKRGEAEALAAAIAGGTGLLPLVGVIKFFIMGVWALGEAVLDVRALFDGEKVPFLKTQDSWRLDLDGLVDMGKTGGNSGALSGSGQGDKGMDYKGYLRLLLFFSMGPETDFRMLDMIQSNLRAAQPGFRADHCAHAVEMSADVCGKHLFLTPGVWKAAAGGGEQRYEMTVAVTGGYGK